MVITRETDYALRILRALLDGKLHTAGQIAQDELLPQAFAYKILKKLEKAGRIIELRAYDTACGVWKYFTADDGQVDLGAADYLMIGTLEAYEKMIRYYGADNILPLYVEVEDGERLARALARERRQAQPKYRELCRRFLADEEDFSEEKLRGLGIHRRFCNEDIEHCLEEITEVIYNGKL